ncbi:MAG: exonuclease domain-containing protein [Acidimicrobiales bacterium]
MSALHEVTFCVLDLETTGTDPGWDDITEVGALTVRGGEQLGTFHTLVGPAAGAGLPSIEAVLPSLLEFAGTAVITGHNISFDVRFLNAALGRSGRPLLDPSAVVDTMYLARALLRDEADDCRLGTLAARFGFTNVPCHRAFEDAAATVELLHLLIERAWSFGATTLDDLQALPALAGHRWSAKLRHTARLPRTPGVALAHDRDGAVVWVGVADHDLRREVRDLFDRSGGAVHASVLRDTERWQVVEVDDPAVRRLVHLRLLHTHRPRLQRRAVLGEQASYVCLEPSRTGWKAVARRRTSTVAGAFHLGPVPSRAEAAAGATGLARLAASGWTVDQVVAWCEGPGERELPDEVLTARHAPDPVTAALARRDVEALVVLAGHHRRVRTARPAHLELVEFVDRLTSPAVPTPGLDRPLPLDLLAEVLAVDVADVADDRPIRPPLGTAPAPS